METPRIPYKTRDIQLATAISMVGIGIVLGLFVMIWVVYDGIGNNPRSPLGEGDDETMTILTATAIILAALGTLVTVAAVVLAGLSVFGFQLIRDHSVQASIRAVNEKDGELYNEIRKLAQDAVKVEVRQQMYPNLNPDWGDERYPSGDPHE